MWGTILFGSTLILVWCARCSCGGSSPEDEPVVRRPNILWIVWDTVRADRLGLYGYEKDTTPYLDEWAHGARVFDDCLSAGSSTVPSHGSMFTAELPTRHGAREGHLWLDDRHETIAELLGEKGDYQTYLWSANPHISKAENFTQGFDVEEHPWDPAWQQRAYEIVTEKLKGDRSSELSARFQQQQIGPWAIKAAGELAEEGLTDWLAKRDRSRPYFAFLNYMEAHRPLLPPRKYRERMMTPRDVERSYTIDRSWVPLWSYDFGLHEYSEDELRVMAGTYDAALAELDDLFRSLIEALRASGDLEDTIVVLTADHGEHLGEHHLLDHQYSLYQDLIHVPLVLRAEGVVEPGRDSRPVSGVDLYPTLLELAGVEAPSGLHTSAVSLLEPLATRRRVAEVPAVFSEPFPIIRQVYPEFDPTPFERRLRTLVQGRHKLIWGEDGRHELYDLALDPGELANLVGTGTEVEERMLAELERIGRALDETAVKSDGQRELSAEMIELLGPLGYVGDGGGEE